MKKYKYVYEDEIETIEVNNPNDPNADHDPLFRYAAKAKNLSGKGVLKFNHKTGKVLCYTDKKIKGAKEIGNNI